MTCLPDNNGLVIVEDDARVRFQESTRSPSMTWRPHTRSSDASSENAGIGTARNWQRKQAHFLLEGIMTGTRARLPENLTRRIGRRCASQPSSAGTSAFRIQLRVRGTCHKQKYDGDELTDVLFEKAPLKQPVRRAQPRRRGGAWAERASISQRPRPQAVSKDLP